MTENKFDKEMYSRYKLLISEITEHYDECKYHGSAAPVDICPCECYSKMLFRLGRDAQEKSFYGGADRG